MPRGLIDASGASRHSVRVMKKAFCLIAGACGLLGWASADEIGMKNVLSDWQIKQSDWESALKTAESEDKKADLMKSSPDAVPVAKALWKQVGRDLQKSESQKSYLLPAVVWFLDHPQAVAQAFPNGELAKKIIVLCLDSLENTLFREQGAGKVAHALSNSRELRCRVILEQIKDYNPFPEDQGLASLGLAMVMKESAGILQDDVRLGAARAKLLKDAIIKCYDSKFGAVPVQEVIKEELYEIRNLYKGRIAPKISLPSTTDGKMQTIPFGDKPILVIFWSPQDMLSVQFLQKAASLRKEFPGMNVMPIALGKSELIRDTLLNLGSDMNSLADEKAVAFKDYRVRFTPRVYLLDADGKILMRGTPDALFDANLYAVMNRKEGKKEIPSPVSPVAEKPSPSPVKINSPDTRVPSAPQVVSPRPIPSSAEQKNESSLSAPPLRPMPE